MGADLYMAQRNFKDPGPRARWEGDILVVERQSWYDYGWFEIWRGELNPDTKKILEAFNCTIPKKPKKCGARYNSPEMPRVFKCQLLEGHTQRHYEQVDGLLVEWL